MFQVFIVLTALFILYYDFAFREFLCIAWTQNKVIIKKINFTTSVLFFSHVLFIIIFSNFNRHIIAATR